MVHTNVVLFILFSLLNAAAQTSSITWQSESVKDLRSNEETPFACQFIIYPNDRIEWVQGEYVERYSLTSTEGNLPAAGSGVVTYTITKEGILGKVTVERISEGDVRLTLDLTKNTKLGAYFSFKVFNP